jgi:uncharacterized protein YndB with AHSA1/START domain
MMPPLRARGAGATLRPQATTEERMKVLKWVLVAIAGLAAVLVLGGLMLSSQFKVSRSVSVNATPQQIYELVADPRRWKEWSVWNRRDPGMQITYSGPPSGAGAVWAWKSKSEGDGRMTFTAAEPGSRVAFDLFLPDFGTTSHGELRFAAEGPGTRVTWSMNGDMGRNPVLRWMTLFMDSMVGKDFEGGLANLKALAEKR